MGSFAVGDVVLATFPYSDLTHQKLRPALVVGIAEFDNLVLSQITSKPYSSKIAIKLTDASFESGGLRVMSYVRPDKLFTADKNVVRDTLGKLDKPTVGKIKSSLSDIFEL